MAICKAFPCFTGASQMGALNRMPAPDHAKLYKEAAFVGIALVPMWILVSKFTTAMQLSSPNKAALDIMLAGAMFHLTAEETGLNAYYLTNSYAHDRNFSDAIRGKDGWVRKDSDVDWIHSSGGAFGFH